MAAKLNAVFELHNLHRPSVPLYVREIWTSLVEWFLRKKFSNLDWSNMTKWQKWCQLGWTDVIQLCNLDSLATVLFACEMWSPLVEQFWCRKFSKIMLIIQYGRQFMWPSRASQFIYSRNSYISIWNLSLICTVVQKKKIFKDFWKNPTWRQKIQYGNMAKVMSFSFEI